MSLDNEPHVTRTIIEEPGMVRREDIRTTERSSTGWWIATIVAVIAVMGLIYLYTSRPGGADLQAATDAGRAQATMENAATQAQNAANSAAAASANAADSLARNTQAAADNAKAAADRTAQSADQAASNASATAPDQPPTNPQ
jgi:hypothetical protein